jgi:ABC-2 type transport system permease protein
MQQNGFFDAVAAGRALLDRPPASIALWPARAVVAPVFAMSRYEWASAIPFAFLVLLLHAWWVVRMDAAFEESSLEASYERVRRIDAWRSRRLSAPRPENISRRGIGLPTWGHPAVAIVWKNLVCLRRTIQLRVFIAPLVMATVWGWIASSKGIFAAITVGALTLAGLFTFFGPMLVRNDLRQDMQNLFALKVLPLQGRTIVFAEVMSSAIPVAVIQLVVLIIAGISARLMPDPPSISLIASILVASPPALLAFAAAMIAVMNGAPVLFPGWVRLGANVGGGMENLGQGVMSMGIILILVALMLVVPAVIVLLAVFGLRMFGAGIATVAAIVLGSATLGSETYGIFAVLGRALERTEPSEAAAA